MKIHEYNSMMQYLTRPANVLGNNINDRKIPNTETRTPLKKGSSTTEPTPKHYKKIVEDRKQKPITVTSTDVAEVKDLLQTLKYDKPNWFEKAAGFIFKGDTGQAAFDQAAEHIAVEVQKEMAKMQENYKGKEPLVIDIDFKKKAIENVLKSGKIKKKESWSKWTSGTIRSTSENPLKKMARGGPVQAGKPYVVGEEGPEIIIPHSSGNVLSNDDSQIYAMLLAANPQLQKVSKSRAESILKSRFPEYFA